MTTRPLIPSVPTRTDGAFSAAYAQLESREQTVAPAWLTALRRAGNAHFCELGFPTTDHEEWRFTNVAPIAALPTHSPEKREVDRRELERFTFGQMPTYRVVFIDGSFSTTLSSSELLDEGVEIHSLKTAAQSNLGWVQKHLGQYARADENAFVALNTSMMEEGAAIRIKANQHVKTPIHLLFVSTSNQAGATTHPRVLILAERGCEARILESYESLTDGSTLTNAVTEIVMEEASHLEHCRLQQESTSAYHVGTVHAHQSRSSNLITHSISMGGRIARVNINPVLDAEGCECVMNGLYVVDGDQLVDHHTAIHHAKPRCNSHEFYHGILDGNSQGVFNGKIFVRPDAQKTDAKQTNRNLLLSDGATIQTKPQLEIFADDVKCTHGATVGQLQEEAVFYLRARGIGKEAARRMLVHAFASDIINRISIEPVRVELDQIMFDLFQRERSA